MLFATAAPGTAFAGWSGGGCTGLAGCSVTVNSPTTVTPRFDSCLLDAEALGSFAGWSYNSNIQAHGGAFLSALTGSSMSFTSWATQLAVYFEAGPSMGELSVSIDGGAPFLIDTSAGLASFQGTTVTTGLAPGEHTITLLCNSGTCGVELLRVVQLRVGRRWRVNSSSSRTCCWPPAAATPRDRMLAYTGASACTVRASKIGSRVRSPTCQRGVSLTGTAASLAGATAGATACAPCSTAALQSTRSSSTTAQLRLSRTAGWRMAASSWEAPSRAAAARPEHRDAGKGTAFRRTTSRRTQAR